MKGYKIPYINETIYKSELDNGLSIFLLPRKNSRQVLGALSVKCGSIDVKVKLNNRLKSFPIGIAHFLEHKLFESEGIMTDFSINGAIPNGHTLFDRTTYTFSCNGNLLDNIRNLFSILNIEKITAESIKIEKEIIIKEVNLKNSDPTWKGIFSLLHSLYEDHPVKYSIGGTEESISQITSDLLKDYFSLFYQPTNMIFVLVGDFDVNEVLECLNDINKVPEYKSLSEIQSVFSEETPVIKKRHSFDYMSINTPYLFIGWKDINICKLKNNELYENSILNALILDSIFGKSSIIYHNLIENGLVEREITWDYYGGTSYGFSYVEVVTKEPKKIERYINDYLFKVLDSRIDEELFESCRKKAIGRYISSFDSLNTLSSHVLEWAHKDCNYFDTIDILNSFSCKDANVRLKSLLANERMAIFNLLPKVSSFN